MVVRGRESPADMKTLDVLSSALFRCFGSQSAVRRDRLPLPHEGGHHLQLDSPSQRNQPEDGASETGADCSVYLPACPCRTQRDAIALTVRVSGLTVIGPWTIYLEDLCHRRLKTAKAFSAVGVMEANSGLRSSAAGQTHLLCPFS